MDFVYVEGALVQADAERKSFAGTPLLHALHSTVMRLDPEATFDLERNEFIVPKEGRFTRSPGEVSRICSTTSRMCVGGSSWAVQPLVSNPYGN